MPNNTPKPNSNQRVTNALIYERVEALTGKIVKLDEKLDEYCDKTTDRVTACEVWQAGAAEKIQNLQKQSRWGDVGALGAAFVLAVKSFFFDG